MKRILKEDITSGSVIVYHRTGSKTDNPVEGIAADGYRVGGGAYYGVGVYTTYNLESQLNDYLRRQYGSIIIESKVLSMKDFLIFDYDIAKRIYGNKNYTLDKQLQLILGKEWNKYKDDNELKDLLSEVNNKINTSNIAENFYENYPEIISKLRGIVFTGRSDGNVLVSYDRKNIEPIRYTRDEGQTWINIINKNIYKRLKGYDTDKNLEIEHIRNKLDTNIKLSQKENEILLNNKELISKLDSDRIHNLLSHSSDRDKVINILLNNKELISKLNTNRINYLLRYSSDRDKVINIALNNKEFISKLDSDIIYTLLEISSQPENIIDILINNKEFLSIVDSKGIDNILEFSKEPENVIDILLNNKEFILRLDDKGIKYLLSYSSEPKKIMNTLDNKGKDFISRLDIDGIIYLLSLSPEPKKIINILGNKGKEILSKINNDVIYKLIEFSQNPEQLKEIIKQLRPDLKLESKINIKKIIQEEINKFIR